MEMRQGLRDTVGAARDLKRRAGRAVRRLRDRSLLSLPGEDDLLRALGGRFGTLAEALPGLGGPTSPFLPRDLTPSSAAAWYEAHPAARERLLVAAKRVLEHRFELLGSGEMSLGPKLPWHADFKSGHLYDASLYFETLREQVYSEFGKGRDVKVPWELARCQHLPLLGQAYWITGDRAYVNEFRDQVADFIATNPIGYGVNWICTMDVAIRAVNWIWAYQMFRADILADREFASLFLRALLAHGRFIAGNLENGGVPVGNHYYADLLGLLFVGVQFRGAQEGDEWRALAAAEIERENDLQTYPDGADFEASTSYHRLMTEMTLTALLVLERQGERRPPIRERARGMAEYAAHYVKPNGLAPQIGDNDDARLQILGDHDADRRDHRPLLAMAGCLLEDPALLALAGERLEEAFWMFGPERVRRLQSEGRAARFAATGALFPHAGTAVLRHGDMYAILDAGPVGLDGHGAHAHNDTLSVELHAGGEDLIVDPGTGGYTADLDLRDRFRSTAAHNTVRVDGQEINPFPGPPFALPGVDRPVIRRAIFRRNFDLVEAEHQGYMRLGDPVRHRRVVLLNRVARRISIEDRLEGRGSHRLEWFFHLAPGVEAALGEGTALLRGRAGKVRFTLAAGLLPAGARLTLRPDHFSPGYGRVVPSTTLVGEWEGLLPITARFVLSVAPTGLAEEPA